MKERQSFSPRVVLTWMVVSLILALGVAGFIYVRYVRYESVAIRHVPVSQSIVVQVDVQQALVYEPFRKHILSLIEAGNRGEETRLKHLERKTTLELGVDTREIVFGFGEEGSWLVSVGGMFRREKVVDGVARLLNDEGIVNEVIDSPPRLRLAQGSSFSVAEDGTLLWARSEARLGEALPRGPARDLTVSGRSQFLSLSAERPEGWRLSGGQLLRSLRAGVLASEELHYEIALELEGPLPNELWSAFRQESSPINLLGRLPNPKITEEGEGHFRITGKLSREEFDALIARLAMETRKILGLPV